MQEVYTVTHGSGIFPTNQQSTAIKEFGIIAEGTIPVPAAQDPRTRAGQGVVVLNPEDFSIQLGLRSQSVSVGTSAVALPTNALKYRRALVVHNLSGNNTIYLGASDVTVADGLPLAAGEKIAFDILGHQNTTIYAISDAGGQDVRIMELS